IYSDIAPLSFEVLSHVNVGREAINFSKYKTITKEIKIKRLKRCVQTVRNEMMPLESYLMFHDEAILTKEDKKILIEWFESELRRLSPDEWI
ncbi:MAG: heme-binding domain-containing protein, partial [Epsilonproteobacteria bacterium]|nr:heme-binding domain-containing protein [Campylobacterota bacterium]